MKQRLFGAFFGKREIPDPEQVAGPRHLAESSRCFLVTGEADVVAEDIGIQGIDVGAVQGIAGHEQAVAIFPCPAGSDPDLIACQSAQSGPVSFFAVRR